MPLMCICDLESWTDFDSAGNASGDGEVTSPQLIRKVASEYSGKDQ